MLCQDAVGKEVWANTCAVVVGKVDMKVYASVKRIQ